MRRVVTNLLLYFRIHLRGMSITINFMIEIGRYSGDFGDPIYDEINVD